MMRNVARIAIVAALSIASANAMAEEQGTEQQQNACKPDVYRLCREAIPVTEKIVACLKQNKAKLSPACRKVFAHS